MADLQALVEKTSEDRSYYFGRISREDANDVLMTQGRDGAFLLRMSATKEGVYTISLTQGHTVRHIRVIDVQDAHGNAGCVLSEGDEPCEDVWQLIKKHMHTTLTNASNVGDAVVLRYPVRCEEDVIAPDLMAAAAECGMERSDFDEDVAKFLEGGVSSSRLARQRSTKMSGNRQLGDVVREAGIADENFDEVLEKFMQGKICAFALPSAGASSAREPAREEEPTGGGSA